MTILGQQIGNIGETGQVPRFIYLNTNSTVAQVTTSGYLNHFIAQGNQVTETDMVLIATKTTPDARDTQVIMCSVSFVVGGSKLTQYGSIAAGFSPATDYTTLSAAGPITGAWQHVGEFNVQAGTGSVNLQSDTGTINVLAPNPGQSANVIASIVSILGTNQVAISSATQVFIDSNGPLALTSAGGDVALQAAGNILLPSLAAGVTGQALYYNNISGVVTFGASGGTGITWSTVNGAPLTMISSSGYIADNAALQTFNLPNVTSVGDEFRIIGNGAGGWTITQGAGQNIQVGGLSSTVGVGGSVSSTNQFDGITLICSVANTSFYALPAVGNLNIV